MEERLGAISRAETLRYLGGAGSRVPEELETALSRCEELLRSAARPRTVWRRFALEPDGRLAGTAFRPAGRDIPALLRDCDAVILMAATLGSETEQLLRRSQLRDMSDAVILDAMASAAVEQLCDRLCAELAARFAPRYLTDRFSPGYGDFPFSQQRELFDVLDITRQIGVSLTPGGLMLPQKSVTALLGISDLPQPRRDGSCSGCDRAEHCTFRREGAPCGAR